MGGCLSGNPNSGKISTHIQRKESGIKDLKRNYKIEEKLLGAGSYGKVFLAHNQFVKEHKVAIKVLDRTHINESLSEILEEFKILSRLDHPNIVKYYETYRDKRYLYLVMEYCPNGDLLDKMIKVCQKGATGEDFVAKVVDKLLHALKHCHMNGIVHRDLKPENVMFGEDDEIKLIDFGLAKQNITNKMQTFAGTPYYTAPEVIQGEYGPDCDLWSLGVLTYFMLSGFYPFKGRNKKELFYNVQFSQLDFSAKEF